MKKRTIVLTALLAGCLVVGCQGKEAKDNTAKDKAKTEIGNEKKEDTKSSDDQEAETEENNAGEESLETKSDEQTSQDTNMEEAQQSVSVTIYSENENADGFDQETISAENLIAQLKKKGMLSEDVQVNSFEETEDDGEKALKLDLNQVYLKQLQSMGSTGEYMIMGSVCNTFLDAYGCNKIQITTDGQEIVTGHAEYPGYNGKFE